MCGLAARGGSRDLNTRNILLTAERHAKIADFGCAVRRAGGWGGGEGGERSAFRRLHLPPHLCVTSVPPALCLSLRVPDFPHMCTCMPLLPCLTCCAPPQRRLPENGRLRTTTVLGRYSPSNSSPVSLKSFRKLSGKL